MSTPSDRKSARRYASMSEFAQMEPGDRDNALVLKGFTMGVKSVDDAKRIATFIVSDESVDRDGDVIIQKGIDWTQFSSNPIVLFAHDAKELPIGKAVKVWSEGAKTLMDIEFATAEMNPKADQVYRLVKGGYLNAGSIGFIPVKAEKVVTKERTGFDLKEIEALEFSIVPVPANPNALVQAVKSGFDVAVLKSFIGGALKEYRLDDKDDVVPVAKEPAKIGKKDLYLVSQVANILSSMDWAEEWAEYGESGSVEALTAVMRQVGDILVNVTVEAVAEIVGEEADEAKAASKVQVKTIVSEVEKSPTFIKRIGDMIAEAVKGLAPAKAAPPAPPSPEEIAAAKALARSAVTKSKALVEAA